MSIMDYNGSAMVAMKGKNCVAIATDSRLSQNLITISQNMQKVFKVNDRCLFGLAGLATDVKTFSKNLKMKTNMYGLVEKRDIKATTFTNLVATSLYEKRFGPFFVVPVVAGLDEKEDGSFEPVIASYDYIG